MKTLNAAGLASEVFDGSETIEAHLHVTLPDLLILENSDIGASCLALCEQLRARTHTAHLPIIMLSLRSEVHHRVEALMVGADDYLVKPFSYPELIARIGAILRRAGDKSNERRLVVGEMDLDPARKRVRRNGRTLHLGPLEYDLLFHFMRSPGRVFSRTQLMTLVWPEGSPIKLGTVSVNVGRLRKAISNASESDPIIAIRGEGYTFRVKP